VRSRRAPAAGPERRQRSAQARRRHRRKDRGRRGDDSRRPRRHFAARRSRPLGFPRSDRSPGPAGQTGVPGASRRTRRDRSGRSRARPVLRVLPAPRARPATPARPLGPATSPISGWGTARVPQAACGPACSSAQTAWDPRRQPHRVCDRPDPTPHGRGLRTQCRRHRLGRHDEGRGNGSGLSDRSDLPSLTDVGFARTAKQAHSSDAGVSL
jgi:hypothetical protein